MDAENLQQLAPQQSSVEHQGVNEHQIITGDTGALHTLVLIGGQWFAAPIYLLRDVVEPKKVFKVPLAPKEVVGVINLRSKIIVLIDTKHILGVKEVENTKTPEAAEASQQASAAQQVSAAQQASEPGKASESHEGARDHAPQQPGDHSRRSNVCFTAEWNNEIYGFQADAVGEIIGIEASEVLEMPDSQQGNINLFCKGLVKRGAHLWLVLDIPAIMKYLLAKHRVFDEDATLSSGAGIDLQLFESPLD